MNELKVLIISDSKPGHYTQSQGLLNQLEKKLEIKSSVLQLKPRIKLANRVLRNMLNRNSPYAERLFRWFYRFNLPQILACSPDLIISTGGDTCGANALLAKKYQCKNLFLGSLRGHDPSLFSAVISTTPLPGVENCIVLDVAPTLVDQDKLKQSATTFLKDKQISRDEKLWTMLIGGEGSGYQFSSRDYQHLAQSMLTLAKKHGIRWLLTTSRRTGLTNEKVLQAALQGRPEIAHAVYYNEKPEKVMQAYLGAGRMIFSSEDSTSMISEAVSAQKPVITFRSDVQDINPGHEALIRRFSQQGYILRVELTELADFSLRDFQFKKIDLEKNYDQILRLIKTE